MSFFSPSPAEDDVGEIIAYSTLLQATRGARNPNLQVVIMHPLHVRNQHSFRLSQHARLDLLSLVIRSRVFLLCHVKLAQSIAMAQKRFDRRLLSPALRKLWLLLDLNPLSISEGNNRWRW